MVISLSSSITDNAFSFSDIERELKPLGFRLADNWDYDHGYFDCKIDNQNGYQVLRLPFSVETGQLDGSHDNSQVRMGEPFLLSHVYEEGVDEHGEGGNLRAIVDQFQEPVDKDGDFPEEDIKQGKEVLSRVEQVLAPKR